VNCPLCDAPVRREAARCSDCGMTLELAAGRPSPFTNQVFWLWAAGLALVWLVVLVVVAVA
jgi:predicted nucleic acid-binding Zn ribbon protein